MKLHFTGAELLREADLRELNVDERRLAIAYAAEAHPELTNADLAELFNCSQTLIRKDKAVLGL